MDCVESVPPSTWMASAVSTRVAIGGGSAVPGVGYWSLIATSPLRRSPACRGRAPARCCRPCRAGHLRPVPHRCGAGAGAEAGAEAGCWSGGRARQRRLGGGYHVGTQRGGGGRHHAATRRRTQRVDVVAADAVAAGAVGAGVATTTDLALLLAVALSPDQPAEHEPGGSCAQQEASRPAPRVAPELIQDAFVA